MSWSCVPVTPAAAVCTSSLSLFFLFFNLGAPSGAAACASGSSAASPAAFPCFFLFVFAFASDDSTPASVLDRYLAFIPAACSSGGACCLPVGPASPSLLAPAASGCPPSIGPCRLALSAGSCTCLPSKSSSPVALHRRLVGGCKLAKGLQQLASPCIMAPLLTWHCSGTY